MKQIKQTIFLCLLWMIGIGVHAEEIPNNEIWYTSSDGKVVKPYYSHVFGTTIISNTYSNGKGVIKFDNSVTSIGNWAFNECSGLTSIDIPNSVTSIGDDAFHYCSGLTSIDIPNSVTSIGEDAFSGCSGLTSIDIPNSVTSIGNYAFYGCSGLTSITIPNSVTSIGDAAFGRTENVTTITVDKMNQFYDSRDNCKAIIETRTNTLIAGCKNTITPNSVTSIGDYAFSGCSGLTSITIPNSVTSIGNSAFSDCSGLTSITIPNSVTSIGDFAFCGCYGLTSITIPNSVTSIGEGAFYRCSGLTSITIPNSVTSIGNWAFFECYGLTSITIPNSVTSIGDFAFCGCYGLTSITIPNSVTSIGSNAFYYCTGLTSITIPNSVTSIGESAFHNCTGLTSIKVSWSQPLSIPTYTFENIDKTNCILYVPKGTSTLYKSAPVWEDFQNIQEYEDEEFLANKKAFEEYKNAEKADAENLAKKGDSQAVLTLITNAKSDIDDLTYDEKITLEANKTKVDSIMTKLENDIKAQREADRLAADKAAYEIYKTTRKADAEKLAKDGDSQVILEMVSKAKTAIDAFTYDEKITLEANKTKVDSIMTKLENDIKAQRIKEEEEQLAADKAAFEIYKTTRKADAENLIKDGDSPSITIVINTAKSAIDALKYDESTSLADNKKAVDAIIEELRSNIQIIRDAEQQSANKAAFEAYKMIQEMNADNLVKDGDSQTIHDMVSKAKTAIESLNYDATITLDANKAKVDAIISELESKIEAQREADQLAADKAAFEAYKATKKADADKLAKDGDSQVILDLVSSAKTAIDALTYNESISLEDNKDLVDAVFNKLESDIKAQRVKEEQLIADKAAFDAYKATRKGDAEKLAKDGDSPAVLNLITTAMSTIDALTYDESMSLDDNKKAVDAVFNKLESDVKAQRIAEQLAADKNAFDAYKSTRIADADKLAKDGDSPAVQNLITNAKSAIDALTYDETQSLEDNKAVVDAIISKLESDVKAQRDAEELWANKLAFNTYRNSRMSDADALAKADDSQEILDVITKAKNEIEGLEYDENKSLSDNMAAVDAIIKQLKVDLENARIAAGMNGINTSGSNMQIHTLDGKKVDSIVKSGFYIINGVKKYVIGNCK